MTQDKPILTEEDFERDDGILDITTGISTKYFKLVVSEKKKQQILTALKEYTKFKKLYESADGDRVILIKECEKLKAENEEFNKSLSGLVSQRAKLQQEIKSLRQLKQRLEILDKMRLKIDFIDWGNYPHSDDLLNDVVKFLQGKDDAIYVTNDLELQQLLKEKQND